jgi:hypothetical protein
MRDGDRSAVAAAEAAAFDGTDLETVRPFAVVAEAIHAVTATAWWPGGPVRVIAARSDARSSSARSVVGVPSVIRLAADQLTIATAAHELAHVLAGPAVGHGPVFLAAYLDVLGVITNLDSADRRRYLHVDQLRQAVHAGGLVVGQRAWLDSPDTNGSPIAL